MRRNFFAVLLFFVTVTAAAQTTLTGRFVGIADGDTITLLDAEKTQHKVRLAGIDAPERGQPGGYPSKESLVKLVCDRPVRVESNKQDRFGRIVGKVWVASPDSPCRGKPDCPLTLDADCPLTLDAGLAPITMGRAWRFRKYADEQSPEDRARYEFDEQEARVRKPWARSARSSSKPAKRAWQSVRENGGNPLLTTLPHVFDHQGELEDFRDTAALIGEMDVIVSVDTSVAHLSGALGKQTWVLLPYAPDWRWLCNRSDSPWYPSMTLFRKTSPKDWGQALAQVRARLAELVD